MQNASMGSYTVRTGLLVSNLLLEGQVNPQLCKISQDISDYKIQWKEVENEPQIKGKNVLKTFENLVEKLGNPVSN